MDHYRCIPNLDYLLRIISRVVLTGGLVPVAFAQWIIFCWTVPYLWITARGVSVKNITCVVLLLEPKRVPIHFSYSS